MSEELEEITNIALYKKGLHIGSLKREEDNLMFYIKGSSVSNLNISLASLVSGFECSLHNNFYAIELKSGDAYYIFTGLDIESLSRFKSWVPVPLSVKELSTSCASFGNITLDKALLSFESPASRGFANELLTLTNNSTNFEEELDSCYGTMYKSMFDLPLNLITKASLPSKGDVVFEFIQPDFPVQDVLCGMRLSTTESGAVDINDFIQEFAPRLKITEKPYLQLDKIFIVTPRGRFSFLFYDQFITLEGTNKQFKIPFRTFKTIVKVQNFKDKINIVIELNPAISIRQTMYQYVLIEFESGDYLEGSNDEDEEVKDAQPKRVKLEKRTEFMEKHEKFLNELKRKTNMDIIEAGDFIGQTEINGVTADFKTNNGALYFLNGYVLFLQKPVILLHRTEIRRVELLRWNNYISKTFDMRISTSKKTYDFGNIEKTEMTEVIDYFVATGVYIENMEEIQLQSGRNGDNSEGKKRFGLIEGNLHDNESDDEPIDEEYLQNSDVSGSSTNEENDDAIETGSE